MMAAAMSALRPAPVTAVEPSWDTTVANATNDNTVVWTTANAWTKQGTVDIDSADRQTFLDAAFTDDTNYFRFGVCTFTSGDNNGLSMDVKSNNNTGTFVLKFAMPFDIALGDTFTVSAGCNHLLKLPGDEWGTAYTGDCRAKFDNVANFDGEPEIPGADKILKGPL